MGIPEGTVLARANREGWTPEIEAAKAKARQPDAENQMLFEGGLAYDFTRPFRTAPVSGDRPWTQVTRIFTIEGSSEVEIACLFGGWGQSTGEAWFDDISLTEAPPLGAPATPGRKQVEIKADEFGFELGRVRANQRLTLQYVEGTWLMISESDPRNWVNPDAENFTPNSLGIYEVVNGEAKLLAGVPSGTKSRPFRYRFEKDYARVILRIQDTIVGDNPGAATYEVTIAP